MPGAERYRMASDIGATKLKYDKGRRAGTPCDVLKCLGVQKAAVQVVHRHEPLRVRVPPSNQLRRVTIRQGGGS